MAKGQTLKSRASLNMIFLFQSNIVNTPVQIATGVAGGCWLFSHSLFLKSGGVLCGMNYNANGELGDGLTKSQIAPVQAANSVSKFATEVTHSLFVRADGALLAMGHNCADQLGDGTTIDANTPVQVAADVSQVAAGNNHSLYLKTNGTLWAMRDKYSGQIGNRTTTRLDITGTADNFHNQKNQNYLKVVTKDH